jgi:molybdate transport system substrate-binding protein
VRRWLLLLAGALLAACGAPEAGSQQLAVFAASSLAEPFQALAAVYTEEHPDVSVSVNLTGSQLLAAQVLAGAPADVLATADGVQMARVADAGLLAADPQDVATNTLVVAVERGNPMRLRGLDDLARDDVVVVLPDAAAPAGRYADELLAGAGVAVDEASREIDVRTALAKVRLGEADAAVVYRTDVLAAGDVDAVDVGDSPRARYPIAVLARAVEPEHARGFADLVLSPRGRAVLTAHGFGAP